MSAYISGVELVSILNKTDLHYIRKEETDGFSIPSNFRAFTWNTNHLIASEVERLDKELSSLGIEQTRVGMEFEFALPDEPVDSFEHWQEVKSDIIKKLKERAIKSSHSEKIAMIKKKINAIEKFNAREVLMYDLIEQDKSTATFMEPLFGQGQYGNGYYDVGDILEMRIKHCDIKEIQGRRNIVLQTLYKKAADFGLTLKQPPHQHMHFSFWKDGKNLFDPNHPEFASTGKTIAEGLTRVLYDVHPILINRSVNTINQPFALPANRDNLVRSATQRYEVRFNRYTHQDPDLVLPIILAGALFSLQPKDEQYYNQNVIRARVAKKMTIHTASNNFNFVSDVLNTTINYNGSLDIPENYIIKKIQYIVNEIITDPLDDEFAVDVEDIIRFFKGVRILSQGNTYKMYWPINKQPNWYEIATLDGKYVSIDVSYLEKEVQFGAVHNRLVISGGYDTQEVLNEDKQYTHPKERARLRRMAESIPLKERLSSELLVAISSSIEKQLTVEGIILQKRVCPILLNASLL